MLNPLQPAIAHPVAISTFYKFTQLPDYRALQFPLKREMIRRNIKGTITLAPEGINATISGESAALEDLLCHLKSLPEIGEFEHKVSHFAEQPFKRSKVKVKPELISLGAPSDPSVCVGEYVDSWAWNALISREDVITIDTRNDYEYRIGRFKGAINPNTRDFKEMVAFTAEQLNPERHPHVAMYCTGGIRCEKYSSYLLEQGFAHVYHLKGGILQYLADIPQEETLWEGSCFVFDERVAVRHDLSADPAITMCAACGSPLTPEDRNYHDYIAHRQCGYCHAS